MAVAALGIYGFGGSADAQLLGGKIVSGQATIASSPLRTVIQQSSNTAVYTWSSFSIPVNASVQFLQPSAASIALNKVTGGKPSLIFGSLGSNGQVWLINGAGITVGSGAQISVAGLILSTVDISNSNFAAGQYSFDRPGMPGAQVSNAGTITITGGSAILAGAAVSNSGVIAARLGTVVLAGARTYAVDFEGDGLLNFAVTNAVQQTAPGATALVANSGSIAASGGTVLLTAEAAKSVIDNVINTSGIIEATSVAQINGKIVLSAEGGGVVASGTLDASGKGRGQTGGTISITGDSVTLTSGALVDVSGDAGGGSAYIGGNFHGSGPLPNAQITTISQGAVIDAAAVTDGNGGQVAVWSDAQTTFAGSIAATGGAHGGNGGYVEVSSENQLAFTGSVALAAPAGTPGTLLLDPQDYDIVNSTQTPETGASFMLDTTLESELASGNVTIATNSTGSQPGDIAVETNITWSSTNDLTLLAYRNITLAAGVTIANTGGSSIYPALVLAADTGGTGTGTVIFGSGAKVDFSQTSGSVSILYNPVSNPAGSVVNSSSYASTVGYEGGSAGYSSEVLLGDSASLYAFMLVNTISDLQNIENNLSGDYAINRNIDASATASWNSGAGFIPIGTKATPFTGLIFGDDKIVSNLTINSTAVDVGLVGVLGSDAYIYDLGLVNANVVSTYANATNSGDVGALVGYNQGGFLFNVFSTGSVASDSGTATSIDNAVGGLVGRNFGSIFESFSIANVSNVTVDVVEGGLVGTNGGGGAVGTVDESATISDSYAGGSVTGTAAAGRYGGLSGINDGEIFDSYSNGRVTVPGTSAIAGGLVGGNIDGTINTSYGSGPVSATGSLAISGGLIGDNTGSVSSDSYWDVTSTGLAAGVGSGTTIAASQGLTTGQMANPQSYGETWDFTNTWYLVSGMAHPILRSELASASSEFSSSQPIVTADQLELIGSTASTLSSSYTLGSTIDMSGILANPGGPWFTASNASLNGGNYGFLPIGSSNMSFSGSFNGAGNAINGLVISSGGSFVGLFGEIASAATVNGVALTNVSVTGTASDANVGGLAGESFGSVTSVSVSGAVTGSNVAANVGGLLGIDAASEIDNDSSAATVTLVNTGTSFYQHVGGLIGLVSGGGSQSIISSNATGNVTGGFGTDTGGLIGAAYNSVSISESYATGAVASGGAPPCCSGASSNTTLIDQGYLPSSIEGATAGGLVGYLAAGSSVIASYATGQVTSGEEVNGGLVGYLDGGSEVLESFATGNVIATSSAAALGGLVGVSVGNIVQSYATGAVGNGVGFAAGGLAGIQDGNGISLSYASGPVQGGTRAGGLVGELVNGASISLSYSSGAVSASGTGAVAGGLVGLNAGTVSPDSYWDTSTTGEANGAGSGTTIAASQGLTTSQMANTSSYASTWNFTNSWYLVPGMAHPILRSELPPTDVIITPDQLELMGAGLSGVYTLGSNIDMSGILSNPGGPWFTASDASLNGGSYGFVPVGSPSAPFAGSLSGGTYAINGLTVNTANEYAGLFGYVSGGSVIGVTLVGASIASSFTTGNGAYVGAVAGYSNGFVSQVAVFGTAGAIANSDVGLVVGRNDGTVANSYGIGSLTSGAGSWMGGLVGHNDGGTIEQSYANALITQTNQGASDFATYVGGLVGNSDSGAAIFASYATGSITSSGTASVGGLVGNLSGTVSASYASVAIAASPGDVGGLIGTNGGTVTNSYWDTTTGNGSVTSGAGSGSQTGITGLSTAQLQAALPSGFDPAVWIETTTFNDGLPFLPNAGPTALSVGANGITLTEGSTLYTTIAEFGQTNDIETSLIAQFPNALFLSQNPLATPFEIANNGSTCGIGGAAACNFYDGFGFSGAGQSLTIPVNVQGATTVYTLINAYAPGAGTNLATIEFIGSGGAVQSYPLVAGTDVRDFFNGEFANALQNTIPGVTAVNAFTVNNVRGAGGSGNVNTGSVGTYRVDEQAFALSPAFAGQTLQQIVITDNANGANPILLGVTVASAKTASPIVSSTTTTTTTTTSTTSSGTTSSGTTSSGTTSSGTTSSGTSSGSSTSGSSATQQTQTAILATQPQTQQTATPVQQAVQAQGPSQQQEVVASVVLPPPASPSTILTLGGGTGQTTGSLVAVTDIDTGGQLFSTIEPQSGGTGQGNGTSNDPVTSVAPVTTADRPEPKPQATETPVGGAGSHVFQTHQFFVQHLGVPGISEPASMGGNRALWFAAITAP